MTSNIFVQIATYALLKCPLSYNNPLRYSSTAEIVEQISFSLSDDKVDMASMTPRHSLAMFYGLVYLRKLLSRDKLFYFDLLVGIEYFS